MTTLGFRTGYRRSLFNKSRLSAIARPPESETPGWTLQRLLCQVHAPETLYLPGFTLADVLLTSIEPCGRSTLHTRGRLNTLRDE